MLALLINDDYPIKRKHICYFTTVESGKITLHEVEEVWYRHPNAPEECTISQLERKPIRTLVSESRQANHMNLLNMVMENARVIERDRFS